MTNGISSLYEIQPEKLVEAREARGYSMNELGKLLGVSRQAIDKYEDGKMSPSPDVLQGYIEKLEFPLIYFQVPILNDDLISTPILHRSLISASNMAKAKIKIRAQWMKRITDYFYRYFDFPIVSIQKSKKVGRYSSDEIEYIAEELRVKWGLGMAPIDNMTILLQNNGIFLGKTNIEEEKLDACSTWFGDRPYALVGSDKNTSVRLRFSLAHELGHFILHNVNSDNLDKDTLKEIEKEANRFAGAFLLPRKTFGKQIISTSIDYFVQLKQRWGVSIAAMIYRCKDLGIISENQTSYLWRQMAARNMRKNEPLDDSIPIERPTLFRDSFKMLVDSKITNSREILEQICLPPKELAELCNIPLEMLDTTIKPIRPKLQLIK